MRSILVPVEECPGLDAQLQTALLAAQAFSAHIDAVMPRAHLDPYAVSPTIGMIAPAGIDAPGEGERERADEMLARYRAFLREHSVDWGDPLGPSERVTASWIADIARGDESVGELARLYELSVLARPVAKNYVPRQALLETVLFESGRLLLVAPPQAPTTIDGTIVIAWNGSNESARSIALAAPFLRRAERVIVLSVEGGMVPGPSARDVARSLARSGIDADAVEAKADGRGPGEAILAEAQRFSAAILIKGAYTHSRLRQMIFGGATHHILQNATIPVLMAH